MIDKILRFVIALALLPLCVAVTLATSDLLRQLPSDAAHLVSPQTASLAGGYLTWLTVYFLLPLPMRAYIWGHELTHALWGLLFGARIHKIDVKAKGGSVLLSKSNTLITLAPYFFPFYTLAVLLLRFAINLATPMQPYELAWLFAVGFTWGFHFTFTIHSLMIRQPDIVQCGRLFSYVLIYLLNLTGIGVWVVGTTPATAGGLSRLLAQRTVQSYRATVRLSVSAGNRLTAGLSSEAPRRRSP
jgi:hypothetical protein